MGAPAGPPPPFPLRLRQRSNRAAGHRRHPKHATRRRVCFRSGSPPPRRVLGPLDGVLSPTPSLSCCPTPLPQSPRPRSSATAAAAPSRPAGRGDGGHPGVCLPACVAFPHPPGPIPHSLWWPPLVSGGPSWRRQRRRRPRRGNTVPRSATDDGRFGPPAASPCCASGGGRGRDRDACPPTGRRRGQPGCSARRCSVGEGAVGHRRPHPFSGTFGAI